MATTAQTGSPQPDSARPDGTHEVPPHAPATRSAKQPLPPGQISRLGIAAVVVTVVLWASAFVGIRAVGPSFSPGSLTLGRLAIAAVVLGLVVLPQTPEEPQPPPGPRMVAHPGLRRHVVRRLQRRPERRRTPARRRHGRPADQRQPDPGGHHGRGDPQGGLPPLADHRQPRRVRRRRGDRARFRAAVHGGRRRGAAVPAGGGPRRGECDRAEAGPAEVPRRPGHLVRNHGRRASAACPSAASWSPNCRRPRCRRRWGWSTSASSRPRSRSPPGPTRCP